MKFSSALALTLASVATASPVLGDRSKRWIQIDDGPKISNGFTTTLANGATFGKPAPTTTSSVVASEVTTSTSLAVSQQASSAAASQVSSVSSEIAPQETSQVLASSTTSTVAPQPTTLTSVAVLPTTTKSTSVSVPPKVTPPATTAKPVTTRPATVKPVTIQPVTIKPVTIQPVTIKPIPTWTRPAPPTWTRPAVPTWTPPTPPTPPASDKPEDVAAAVIANMEAMMKQMTEDLQNLGQSIDDEVAAIVNRPGFPFSKRDDAPVNVQSSNATIEEVEDQLSLLVTNVFARLVALTNNTNVSLAESLLTALQL